MPKIYEVPLQGRVIARVDKLKCLINVLGSECFVYREYIYNILSGGNESYDLNKMFASIYRRYPKVSEYVSNLYYYGDASIPIIDRCIKPLREMVDNYGKHMYETLTSYGGKYLVQTHDILYFSFLKDDKIKELKGVDIIC